MKNYLLLLAVTTSLAGSAQVVHTVTNLNLSGPGSLGYYISNSASGDTIRFSTSLLASGSDTIHFSSPMIFDHGVVIEGLFTSTDTLYLSGEGVSQIFYIDFQNTPGEEVHFSNLVLLDGYQYSSTNTAYYTHGGAIMARGLEMLSMKNVFFRNCRAAGSASGGAVMVNSCRSVQLEDCGFVENHTDTTIADGAWGGAISAMKSNTYINRCNFSNNYTIGYGGAVEVIDGLVVVRNTLFMENHVVNTPSSLVKYGGAMECWTDSLILIDSCVFVGNYSGGKGGALSLLGSQQGVMGVIRQCSFIQNTSDESGSAIVMYSSSSPVQIIKSTFIGNLGNSLAGSSALYATGKVVIDRSTFVDNQQGSGSSLLLRSAFIRTSTITSSSSGGPLVGVISPDTIRLAGSILSQPTGSSTTGGGSTTWLSGGYNIFSDTPAFSGTLDITNVDSTALGLLPLGMYGGITTTRPPGLGSPALNTGNPALFHPAQNGPIYGQRDIGAAEYQYIIQDSALACGQVNWWGNTYSTPGTYTDTVYNANSIDSVGVLQLYGQDATVLNNGGALTAQSQEPGTTYQWLYCDSAFAPVPAATAQTFIPQVNGSYAVVLANGTCTDTSDCMNYYEVSLAEISSDEQWIRFYPNPTEGRISLEVRGDQPKTIVLLDIQGRKLWSEQIGTSTIQLPKVSAGVYLLRWESEFGKIRIDRVIIEH